MISVTKLVKLYRFRWIGSIARKINLLLGVDIPRSVCIGENVKFPHNAIGTVIHPKTVIRNNVKIYQNVTLGRSDIWNKSDDPNCKFESIKVEEGAIICAGAKVLCREGTLVIGENSIVAANAVLLNSIGKNEIWAGIPAKCVGIRE